MPTSADLDPRTPVLVGVGQAAERLDGPGYRALSPVELAADAARRALLDARHGTDAQRGTGPRTGSGRAEGPMSTPAPGSDAGSRSAAGPGSAAGHGADAERVAAPVEADGAGVAALAAAIDVLGGIRQFEVSTPVAHAPLGRSDNFPRSVAARIGADPTRAILAATGGQGPQQLVTELAGAIARGEAEVALVCGAEAISTVRHLASLPAGGRRDFGERVGGQLEDRGFGLAGLIGRAQLAHRLTDAPSQYALCEHARRGRLKLDRAAYAEQMARLFAPFSAVAAANPYAAAPTERTVTELATPSGRNRPIADPYTRYLVARDQVNQGAAVLVMSLAAARRLGVSESRWVYLRGHADLHEPPLLRRPDLGRSPASGEAVRVALNMVELDFNELDTVDLYSCFPIAVSTITDAVGADPTEGSGTSGSGPGGLTLTGGLPFFGGPGNNYSLHAIAETVVRARSAPGSYGLVGANGGVLSKYSTGVYSTVPGPWLPGDDARVQARLDAVPTVALTEHPDGPATIETYTVRYDRDRRTGVVVGRLDADHSRFVATTVDGDDELLARLTGDDGEPLGAPIYVRSFGYGNRVTTTEARMDELLPPRPPVLRERYEHVEVRRDGHLLEVTINRPDVRNALHPPANDELDAVFDAYFADPRLWVAILTGAGGQAFSAGNDLGWTARGKPMWVPKNGFAGLTARRDVDKPVIAAVNGYALGGGFEIALACHLVVADAAASFGLTEVRVGLVAAAGGLVRLPRALPPALAHELILTGGRLTAEQALGYGLVNRVTPAGEALDGARALAAEILAGSPTSVRTSLRLMAAADRHTDPVEAVRNPSDALDDLLVSADMHEGVTAFDQKRSPIWRNL